MIEKYARHLQHLTTKVSPRRLTGCVPWEPKSGETVHGPIGGFYHLGRCYSPEIPLDEQHLTFEDEHSTDRGLRLGRCCIDHGYPGKKTQEVEGIITTFKYPKKL